MQVQQLQQQIEALESGAAPAPAPAAAPAAKPLPSPAPAPAPAAGGKSKAQLERELEQAKKSMTASRRGGDMESAKKYFLLVQQIQQQIEALDSGDAPAPTPAPAAKPSPAPAPTASSSGPKSKAQLEKEALKVMRKEGITSGDAGDVVAAMNKMLEAKGIAPVELNSMSRIALKYQNIARKEENGK